MSEFAYKHLPHVRSELQRRLARHRTEWLSGAFNRRPFEPVECLLKGPNQKQAQEDIQAFEAWVHEWGQFAFEEAEVIQKDFLWPFYGAKKSMPERLRIDSLEAVLKLCDASGRTWQLWQRALSRLKKLEAMGLGAFARAESECARTVFSYSDEDFIRLGSLLKWLLAHCPCRCFIREIPVEGVDTKWLETHRKEVVFALAAERSEADYTFDDFKRDWAIQEVPHTVRVRNAEHFIAGLAPHLMVELPAAAMRSWQPRAAVIIENIQTGLSIDVPEDIPVFLGLGYGLDVLNGIGWLEQVPIFYFGDLDRDGLRMLAIVKKRFPRVESFAMQSDVFDRYRHLAVSDPNARKRIMPCPAELNEDEVRLWETLEKTGSRLEQERIPLVFVNEAFAQAAKNVFFAR